ncbi:transposase [Rhodopirellula baltica]|nr:transposase [Rhodopirellula baltica]
MLDERTAADPKDPTVRWTHFTIAELTRKISENSAKVSPTVINRWCRERNLKRRRQVGSVTKSPSRGRDEQFAVIDHLREVFRRSKDAIFSVDSKQKEMLGAVPRPGEILADGEVSMLDHPLPSYSDGEVVTHGIYDPQNNAAHMNLSQGHDTGAFSCASLKWFWKNIGRHAHQMADRILLLMDCGGSNSFRSNVFKHKLVGLSAAIGLPIQVAHYPVYCSKYNPIERRAFPWIERAYRGQHFETTAQMADAIVDLAKTATGFQSTAHVMKQRFKPATRKARKAAAGVKLQHPESPQEYNYRVTPEIAQL